MATLIDLLTNSNQLLTSLVSTLVIFVFFIILFSLFAKIKWKRKKFLSAFFSLERWPFAGVCSLINLYFTFPFKQITNGKLLEDFLVIVLIISITWFFLRLIKVIKEIIYDRFPVDKEDNLQERKVRTQYQYIQSILFIIIILVGIGFILLQFDGLQALGTGLLASAGVVGIIIGFASHQILANLLAGFQIAFTQPFRIDDVVIVEGEWGRIEEITLTYVVVRIWDQRRLVLPITYFINNPFQNWTRTTAEIWGSVFIYVDYSVPIEKVRDELKLIVTSSDLWDGKVAVLQVTDTSERTITLRALVSARNASDAWSLRCFVREKLIQFLQEKYPNSLPRIRIEEKSPKN